MDKCFEIHKKNKNNDLVNYEEQLFNILFSILYFDSLNNEFD